MVVCGCVSPSDDPYDVSGRWLRESDVVCVGTVDEWAAQNAFDDESGGDGRLTIAQSGGTLFVTFGDGTSHEAILHGDDVSFVDAQLAGWIVECSECLDELWINADSRCLTMGRRSWGRLYTVRVAKPLSAKTSGIGGYEKYQGGLPRLPTTRHRQGRLSLPRLSYPCP